MKKSGLHKNIASIFDGGSPSCTEPAAFAPADSGSASSVFKRLNGLESQDTAAISPAPAATGIVADSDVQDLGTLTQASSAAEGRPMPLPKVTTAPKSRQTRVNWSQQVQKRLFGPSGVDPQQKKMAVLAGGLAVVFGLVLFFSLGGGVAGVQESDSAQEPKTDAALNAILSGPAWVMPESLPETLRDPMKPLAADVAIANAPAAAADPFVVKGIVFSQKRASALINDQIIGEGQEFDGIKVVRITKTEVEFEADGRRWTQPVRP